MKTLFIKENIYLSLFKGILYQDPANIETCLQP